MDPLKEQLRKLVRLLQPHDIPLIIGGGYGLVLRTEYIRQSGLRTRFTEVPNARSTDDIDIFLSVEIICDPAKMQQIRMSLDELGYAPYEPAKYYQFVLPNDVAGLTRQLKVDLLSGDVRGEKRSRVRIDERRIRPRESSNLHARITPEAITIEECLLPVEIGDDPSESARVYLPHPLSFLILKLHALSDRRNDGTKGPYHAFDIYRITAMMTKEEWEESEEIIKRFSSEQKVVEARVIVREMFASAQSQGPQLIRVHAREVGYEISNDRLEELVEDLQQILQA